MGYGQRLMDKIDYCVECMSSNNVIVSSDEFSMTFESTVRFNESYPTLSRHEADKVPIPLVTNSKEEDSDTDENFIVNAINGGKKEYKFFGLQPGYRYTVRMTRTDTIGSSGQVIDPVLQCPIVTSCSCDHLNYDRTGRPGKNQTGTIDNYRFLYNLKVLINGSSLIQFAFAAKFSIYQANGHIMFEFQDKSRCANAFSFTRMDGVDEFMTDATKFSTSFTSDFNFNAAGKCVDGKII